jgi:phosphate butyryltransferase
MEKILNRCMLLNPVRLVVARPYDRASLRSIRVALDRGFVSPILVGSAQKIRDTCNNFGIQTQGMQITDVEEERILEASAAFILDGRADLIMKGMVGTGNFIHVLLDPRWGIRTEEILTHVGMFEIPHTRRVFLLSDAGINIRPNFTRKIAIVLNAVGAARKLGIKNPRVAMLAAVEKVQLPAMPATLDAFLMKKYSKTGYFGRCKIDGPFAFDNAIDPEKAKTKDISGKVAGNANVIIVPNIETGNVVWKSITSLQNRDAAGVVLGGRCPIVVPSRSDDYKTKLMSIQLARLLMN